ncbi:unnamed protein product [Linum tenue]|uniref:Uncharacterized protein n=1 Tax=Linum tenue TaxID=586396 RepID=A0AAV0J296_9ROSI|nr:unnamed protein product [Linum tenue]CAI0419732.1 unnamed protein product [Linum tenue]
MLKPQHLLQREWEKTMQLRDMEFMEFTGSSVHVYLQIYL